MATFFRTTVKKDISTTLTTVLETTASNRFTIIGCNLANKLDEDVIISIFVEDALAVEGYYIKELIIPPYTSAKVITNGEKLILAESCKFKIISDTANSIDAVVSYAEIV